MNFVPDDLMPPRLKNHSTRAASGFRSSIQRSKAETLSEQPSDGRKSSRLSHLRCFQVHI